MSCGCAKRREAIKKAVQATKERIQQGVNKIVVNRGIPMQESLANRKK